MPTEEQLDIILESELEFKTFKEEPMSNNTQQLPTEVLEEINNNANKKYRGRPDSYHPSNYKYIDGFMAGATEYATKLHEAQQAFYKLDESFRASADEYARLNGQYVAALTLLQKFISRHEAGLLPDRFIYDEIKTFLDGTK